MTFHQIQDLTKKGNDKEKLFSSYMLILANM